MDSDQEDRYKITPILDCQGTCKTPIGCTCYKSELNQEREEVAAKADEQEVEQEQEQELVTVEARVAKVPHIVAVAPPVTKKCCGNKKNCACSGRNKLEVYDWLEKIPMAQLDAQMVEVQFKNTRKSYYLNSTNIELNRGDIVAVEATPGHDIGEVTLLGKLVQLQMKKNNFRGEVKRIYRIAKPGDIEKSDEAKSKEHKTMIRARVLAEELELNMKISDVEYQGDGNKAIFYYIADDRVDFRQLIKVYASEFRIKIEMKQIGARQEAGRVGGIGPCGRELCCSSSMSNFVSVSTSAARLQDIPLNPQKLAGQCGKLKCCLNFEVDVYVEAQHALPSRDIILETKDSSYFHFKTDILSGMMSYSTAKYIPANLTAIHKDRVYEVIEMNKAGKRPLYLADKEQVQEEKVVSHDVLDQEGLDRFDGANKSSRNNNNRNRNNNRRRGQNDERPKNSENQNTPNNNKSRDEGRGNNAPRNNNKPRRNPNNPNRNNNAPSVKTETSTPGNNAGNDNAKRPPMKKKNNRPPRNNDGKTDNSNKEA